MSPRGIDGLDFHEVIEGLAEDFFDILPYHPKMATCAWEELPGILLDAGYRMDSRICIQQIVEAMRKARARYEDVPSG